MAAFLLDEKGWIPVDKPPTRPYTRFGKRFGGAAITRSLYTEPGSSSHDGRVPDKESNHDTEDGNRDSLDGS